MLIGCGGLILRQIARRDDQIAWPLFSMDRVKNRLITLGVHAQKRLMLFGKKVGVGDL